MTSLNLKDAQRAKLIEEMLKSCLRGVESESTATFVESLNRFYSTNGWLTDKQFSALKRIHDEL